MRRQSQYLSALKAKLTEKCQADSRFALDMYDALEPYMVTSLTRNDFIKLAASLIDAEEQEAPEIAGTNATGKMGFNEFTWMRTVWQTRSSSCFMRERKPRSDKSRPTAAKKRRTGENNGTCKQENDRYGNGA